ncbi:Z-ring associated protein ZapG [Vibrio sp. TH_r3]|uniref:Z-ring associated protein ZapG n=1 Tax=Vibrio sp. TH_r3 TaxID=3082084 RepID=UPI002952CDFC|nr:Z-ring associated protein ZapG [Vibrio sp. TH_r3]MDV7104528.1 Z-ring associated protein ZapG [Vibrio sp. TH_r3]
MPWIYAVVGLLVGAILGIVISRIKTPQYKKHQQIKSELASTKFELEQQRQELTDHFSTTAELLDVLGKDYTKLYQHIANTSSELLANLPVQDQPFDKKLAKVEENTTDATDESQPKDYAKGATGLLTPEKKEIIEAPEVVKAP